MSKFFVEALQVELAILAAILGLGNSTFASEALAVRGDANQIVTVTVQPFSSLKQNIHIQEPNTPIQVMSVSQQLDVNSISLQKNFLITVTETNVNQLVTATDQASNISPKEQINQEPQKSDTKIQVTSLFKPFTEQVNFTQPTYSVKASDLGLGTLSPIRDLSYQQYYLSKPTVNNQISEAVTQQANQPENPPPDKSQYNLFNPTPRKLWREFSTDRPDKTETPFTVDAGHFTMEADLFVYTRDVNNKEGDDITTYNFFVPNFKVGLTNNVDLQIIPEFYNVVRTKPKGGRTEERTGFGDITARVKVNFWGNDGGKTAFGMMPFIKFPTNQNKLGNNSIEGGIIFPLAIGLSKKWDVGMQTEFDFNKNQSDPGYNVGFVNTVSFGHELTNKLSTYFELFTDMRTERGSQFVATFDTGLKYLLTENIQLDAGVNIGITQAADDFQPFLGCSVRF